MYEISKKSAARWYKNCGADFIEHDFNTDGSVEYYVNDEDMVVSYCIAMDMSIDLNYDRAYRMLHTHIQAAYKKAQKMTAMQIKPE
jgi:hypothetical protein